MNASLERSPLGKPTRYADQYDAALLYTIARAPEREGLGIAHPLPFSGVDVWTAYELSWLNGRGKPEIALATFRIPVDSPNVVESKSVKLYVNSFSGTRFASATAVARTLRDDLSRACEQPVTVTLTHPHTFAQLRVGELPGQSIDDFDVEIGDYSPAPHFLVAAGASVDETLVSNLFKSNCPVTGQPDWGSVQIRYRGPRIDHVGLLRYIVSFRRHESFHEHCVERMFVEITERCRPERLSVHARFVRRGGIDINPFRSNWEAPPADNVRSGRQ
jgi:7-cyano-7-deazaguanine reductase